MHTQHNKNALKLRKSSAGGEQSQNTPARALEKWLLKKLLYFMGNPALRFILWDGEEVAGPQARQAACVVHLGNRKTFWRLLLNPGLNFGDDYSAGLIRVEGGLVEMLEAVYAANSPFSKSKLIERYIVNRPTWMRHNSLRRAKKNIYHHYDIGNKFYKLWLDAEMVYTCAYFPHADCSLEAAQTAKMAHICNKLQLQAGERVVEAGCGWGSLALYMAKHHDVHVHAYNISREQIEYAQARARAEGLEHKVHYIQDDYRKITGQFDVFVSVGMLEHVGRSNHKKLGDIIDAVLKPDGRGLIHSISQNEPRPVNAWLERRIFPGGYSPTLTEIAAIIEPQGCAIIDVENLRLHYAKTVEHWLARFSENEARIRAMYDENFVRAWQLYLAASIANFRSNSLQLYQVQFMRTIAAEVPLTRAHLYQ